MNSDNIGMIIIVNQSCSSTWEIHQKRALIHKNSPTTVFNLDKKYPMIISTPCSRYCKNVQFSNRKYRYLYSRVCGINGVIKTTLGKHAWPIKI